MAYQHELRKQIVLRPLDIPVKHIGGADISFNKYSETVYAGIIVLSYPELHVVDKITVIDQTRFPYIPGLLAFREVPALLKAWKQLQTKPDVMVLDGQGIAHQRRLGIATHFGLVTGAPSIGCAKSRLTGNFTEPENIPFAESILYDQGEEVGIVLRTKRNCEPVYVSPGHRVSMRESVDIIKHCVGKHRIPEPTRLAHLLVNQSRVAASNNNNQQELF
ncbi:deoxyribonuclease V [Pedobacter sp. BS3]|uniref:deoxyribonuclease V n=1 Tax=Pedobacter sp. BS3 TaxID=2567937 RepID=UPI0021D31C8F|nr:deoxyribonuclease V [Pedobacter sp. BS3]